MQKTRKSIIGYFIQLWVLFHSKAPKYFNYAVVLAILSAVMPFVLSHIQGMFIDSLVGVLQTGESLVGIYTVLFYIVLAFSFSSIVDFLFTFVLNVRLFYINNITQNSAIMRKKSELDLGFYDNAENITRMNYANDSVQLIAGYFSFLFDAFFTSAVSFVVSVAILTHFSPVLVLVLLGSLVPYIVILYYSSQAEIKRWKGKTGLKKHTGTVAGFFGQTKYLTEIKIYNIGEKLVRRYVNYRNIIDQELLELSQKYLYKKMAGSVIRYIGLGFVMMLLAQPTIDGTISIGQATFYLATIFALSSSAQSLFTNLARARQELILISAFLDFLDTPVNFSGKGSTLEVLNVAPQIEFRNVFFGYRPDNTIISDASFTINSGEKVAIVGLNGAGKTTLIKLLCRVYDPTSGVVSINGESLSDIDPDSWYRNLSVVFQDYGRYEFLVKESIGVVATGDIDMEQVRASAKLANISAKIESFDNQYDTQLGSKFPKGEELSVGQWQKLAIARALYRKSKVIILDEPTSSVDADAEEEIFNSLHRLSGDTTLIFVSHRFSTIRQADKIIFVANGVVDCVGSHEHLMQNSHEYKRLYDLQSRAYTE